MRNLILIVVISAIALSEITVMPNASRFINQERANMLYLDICEKLGIPFDEIVDITVIAPGDDDEVFQFYKERTPEWGVAIAVPQKKLVIMKRAGNRPYRVLAHEITHILVHQKAKTRIPRWFDEGVAESVSRKWTMTDDFRMAHFVLSGIPSLSSMENLYDSQFFEAENLYALAYLSIEFLRKEYGEDIAYRILDYARMHRDFETGFRTATSISTSVFEQNFRNYIAKNYGIVRLLTNPQMLWYAILFLFLIGGTIKIIKKWRCHREEYPQIEHFPDLRDNIEDFNRQ